MGPAIIKFSVLYENDTEKTIKVHVNKDQNEADGLIMAARVAKALYPLSMIVQIRFEGVDKEEE